MFHYPNKIVSVHRPLLVSPSIPYATHSISAQRRRPSQAPSPQPFWQHRPEEVNARHHDTSQERQDNVEYGARVDVTPHAAPLNFALHLWKRRRWKPSDAEAQR